MVDEMPEEECQEDELYNPPETEVGLIAMIYLHYNSNSYIQMNGFVTSIDNICMV